MWRVRDILDVVRGGRFPDEQVVGVLRMLVLPPMDRVRPSAGRQSSGTRDRNPRCRVAAIELLPA